MTRLKITALAGGVGGAKLAHGLAQILPPEDLTVIVNAGRKERETCLPLRALLVV